ncbi:DUF1120 domain-containing protein [Burkholderia dolosa]|uniref:hypothetical protein n=1 Tax=Burkholderia dolosa TaxID=152500 RepID=UPI0000F0E3AE|nr:hypothetical protein [Burkholderia dolosa]EAY71568.1 hypothetical protein BDAG_04406 [Burkholderia dolosa AU0158]UAK65621.1 hypothetical protein K8O94_25165 [Burkholderia dolosa]UEB51152.1 hypothetical protein LK423_06280 [Burkholderia dolosa]UEC13415.1 hypothetical protein LK445_04075 [Burkholderia dolosa]
MPRLMRTCHFHTGKFVKMRNKRLRLRGLHPIHGLAAQVLLSLLPAAYAQDCTLNLSEPLLDFGDLNRAELHRRTPDGRYVPAGTRSALLTVHCEQPAEIVLRFDAQPAGRRRFAWTEHGSYTVAMRDARLDGHPVLLARIGATDTAAHAPAATAMFAPDEAIGAMSKDRVAKGSVFTAHVDVEAQIAPEALRVRDETPLTGHGQLRRVE